MRPPPLDICTTLNATLDDMPSTLVRLSAARWMAKGNLVLWGTNNTTAQQLTNALPQLTEVLQTSLSAMAQMAPFSLPTVRHNVKWSRLFINSVPTGVTDTNKAHTPNAVHRALAAENPTYASLTITQKPSWVCNPDTYAPSSSSSLSFAFQDPDGSGAQRLLQLRTLFAFGHVMTLKRWKETPPKKRNTPNQPNTQTPSRGPEPNNPMGQDPSPSVYNPAPMQKSPSKMTQQEYDTSFMARRAAKRRNLEECAAALVNPQ
jgi:hypothetical protein